MRPDFGVARDRASAGARVSSAAIYVRAREPSLVHLPGALGSHPVSVTARRRTLARTHSTWTYGRTFARFRLELYLEEPCCLLACPSLAAQPERMRRQPHGR